MSSISKKKERATSEQLQEFLEFCSQHPQILQRKHQDVEENTKLWLHITNKLNEIKGPTRTTKQWKQTLFHWKDQVVSRIRRNKLSSLKSMETDVRLEITDFDRKALKVFGLSVREILINSDKRSYKIDERSNSSFVRNSSDNEVDDSLLHITNFSKELNNQDLTKDEIALNEHPTKLEDHSNSSLLEEGNQNELHEMEMPFKHLMQEVIEEHEFKMEHGNMESDHSNKEKNSRTYKRLANELNSQEIKKPFTEQIVIKLNSMDAKFTALNANLTRIANAIEKIANNF